MHGTMAVSSVGSPCQPAVIESNDTYKLWIHIQLLATKMLAVDYKGIPLKIPLGIPYIIILRMTISG